MELTLIPGEDEKNGLEEERHLGQDLSVQVEKPSGNLMGNFPGVQDAEEVPGAD